MHNKRVYNITSAIKRLKNYCAIQDRCQWDILQKMNEWGLQENTKEHILEILITEKYIDEERFAISFSRGKFKIKHWGKNKIKHELKQKKISAVCINTGINEINDFEYKRTLEKLLKQKEIRTKEKNPFAKRNKIATFLIKKGFENSLVWERVLKLEFK